MSSMASASSRFHALTTRAAIERAVARSARDADGTAALCDVLQIRHDCAHASVEQHVNRTMARPDDEGRPTVGPLEARSFVARGFGQPLLVGNGIVQGAGWQQLVLLQGQPAEIDGSILGIHPVIHVVPGV